MAQDRKTAVVTGGNSGVGFVTARELVRLGWRVIVTGRDEAKVRRATEALAAAGEGEVDYRLGDFGAFDEVRALAEALNAEPRIDVLLNNVGVALGRRRVSRDGIEMMLQINHLSPFLLTNLLLEKLKASAPARIVVVSSRGHLDARDFGFDDPQFNRFYWVRHAYNRTKLYNVLFARELARRLAGTGVTANALHPGELRTRIGHDGDMGLLLGMVWPVMQWWTMGPLEEGWRVTLHVATAPELESVSGKYFSIGPREETPSRLAQHDEAARRLWDMSRELVGLDAGASGHPSP